MPEREPSPLAALVSRALGREVEAVGSVALDPATVRLSFAVDGRPRTLLLERFPPGDALPVRLLPFLARKSDRVPAVHARGEPHVPAAPRWLLREDTSGWASACARDPRAVIDAKVDLERSVARDGPALASLGVPARTPADIVEEIALVAPHLELADARTAARWLRRWPAVLCHGRLVCGAAVDGARGVVLVGWRKAHTGCGLLDAVRLAADLARGGDAILGVDLPKQYAEAVDITLSSQVLRGAELIDKLAYRHLDPLESSVPSRPDGRGARKGVEEVPGSAGQGSG